MASIALSVPILLFLGIFLGPLHSRIEQARNYGSILAFSKIAVHPHFLGYSRFALDGRGAAEVAAIQRLVPAGETIVAWIALPLHLDFRRNRIYDVQPAGLGSPLLVFPFDKGVDGAVDFFRTHGIRYVIWQHRGYGVRSQRILIGALSSPYSTDRKNDLNTFVFNRTLARLGPPQADVIHYDGQYMIFRIRGQKSTQVR